MSDATNRRAYRVGQELHRELSLLVDTLKDPRIGFATITQVRLTNDLRQAKVFVSVYADADARAASIEGLQSAQGYLRRALGQRLKLRHLPELTFCLDETLDNVDRLESVMQAIKRGDSEAPPAKPTEFQAVQDERASLRDRAELFAPPEDAADAGDEPKPQGLGASAGANRTTTEQPSGRGSARRGRGRRSSGSERGRGGSGSKRSRGSKSTSGRRWRPS